MPTFNVVQKKLLAAWCLYDWASSAFPVVITTFIFAPYFTTQIAANEIAGTYQWANAPNEVKKRYKKQLQFQVRSFQ